MRSLSRPVKNGDPPGRFLRQDNFSPDEKSGRESATLAPVPQRSAKLSDAILGSLAEGVVVIDRDGVIVMVNTAWTSSPLPMFVDARPGANYFALCRRAAAEGHREFAAIDEGTRAVARGQALRYQATVAPLLAGDHESFVVTATPLRDHADGAVITHAKAVPAQPGELAHSQLAMTGLSARLVAAQEQERSRVGRELHDDLGQRTASLVTRIEMLLRTPRLSATRLRAGVADAKREVQELAVAIHQLSHQLHSPRLKLLGLVKTLEGLCRDVTTESGLEVIFRADNVPPDVPEHIALCAWRVAQEALQNAVKHSGAQTIHVVLTGAPSQLTFCVSDTGRGFDPLTSRDSGIGLLSMHERVELTGGRLLIHSGSSGGTTIEAVLPLTAQPAASGTEAE